MLRQQSEFVGTASIQGRLYAIRDYPGLILSGDQEERVIGEIYRLHEPDATLASLDEYEGAEYERVQADAQLTSGEAIRVWVYAYRQPVDETRRVKSGDFRAV
jgi:gamma-glutamylcyclotransferase (GGCT)/AIG2-like uncharacterized protein YtfP